MVKPTMQNEEWKDRPAIQFIVKSDSDEAAKEAVEKLGATIIRPLTEKEMETETEDGRFDIQEESGESI